VRTPLIALAAALALAACSEGSGVERAMRAETADRERAAAAARAACGETDMRPETQTTEGGVVVRLTRRTTDHCLPQPGLESLLLVHYEGRLESGRVFDSSYERGQPAEFPLGRVVPGWQEGLQLLKPGDEAILEIPAALGYGAQGAPPDIPPNADLVFRVELLAFANSQEEVYYAPGLGSQEGQ
jgi:FKBP-type peptidyl-prolyl cis-trans isomerase FkpA/FKBP-type peptidyl-prolyl cis-trans isomerase FklB